jgi:hypothetical protein
LLLLRGKDHGHIGLLRLLWGWRILRAIAIWIITIRGVGIVVATANKDRVCENERRGIIVIVMTEAAAIIIIWKPPVIRSVAIHDREKIPAADIDAARIYATNEGTSTDDWCAAEHWRDWGSTGKDSAAEIAKNAYAWIGSTARENDAAKGAMQLAEHTGA